MHILPLLLNSVLFWLLTSPYQVCMLTYILLLSVRRLRISCEQGYTVLFSNMPRPYLFLVLWCVIVRGTTVHQVPVKQPGGACRFLFT